LFSESFPLGELAQGIKKSLSYEEVERVPVTKAGLAPGEYAPRKGELSNVGKRSFLCKLEYFPMYKRLRLWLEMLEPAKKV
jgi:hypothetical protein